MFLTEIDNTIFAYWLSDATRSAAKISGRAPIGEHEHWLLDAGKVQATLYSASIVLGTTLGGYASIEVNSMWPITAI
eukprot:COSAG01_NODE_38031_length_495_cov_1.143939_2_plen_76_part_01